MRATHARLRASRLFQRFTLFTRTLLAVGFIAPGITKALGFAFAPGVDPASAAGAYFEAFHGTGPYYVFVGLAQALAGVLLLWRRTALAGAALYLPIIGNIAALTWAVGFGTGTPLVTALMCLACVWLVIWDGHRLAPIVNPAFQPAPGRDAEPEVWDLFVPSRAQGWSRQAVRLGYVTGTGGVLALTLWSRGLAPEGALSAMVGSVGLGGVLTVAGWVGHAFARRELAAATHV